MKTYLVEYINERINTPQSVKVEAVDKTEARDNFLENNPNVETIIRITWVPQIV